MFARTLQPLLQGVRDPVMLLEGTRNLPQNRRDDLAALGGQLAAAFPHAAFRSGNAAGSDEFFAKGVASVPGSRLELILPNSGMGSARRPRTAVVQG